MKHQNNKYNDRIQDSEDKIPEDEPVFLIRAQDKISGDILRTWAQLNEDAGGDKNLSDQVRQHAKEMDLWPVKKLAD